MIKQATKWIYLGEIIAFVSEFEQNLFNQISDAYIDILTEATYLNRSSNLTKLSICNSVHISNIAMSSNSLPGWQPST